MRGRRGVEDDQPVVAAVAQLPELLHRDVLLRAGERARQRLVEAVLEDLVALLRRGVAADELVPGALHVEHHRVHRRLRRQPRAPRAGSGEISASRLPSSESPSALASRRAGSMVHTSELRPRRRGAQRERRRDGGLADAARADADQHVACSRAPRRSARSRLLQQRLERGRDLLDRRAPELRLVEAGDAVTGTPSSRSSFSRDSREVRARWACTSAASCAAGVEPSRSSSCASKRGVMNALSTTAAGRDREPRARAPAAARSSR